MTVLLLLAGAARADAGLDGFTGVLLTPTAETLPRTKASFSVSGDAYAVDGGFQASALPFGLAVGMTRTTELGAALVLDRDQGTQAVVAAGVMSARVRQRVLYPSATRPALAVELGYAGYTGPWQTHTSFIASQRLFGMDLHASASARLAAGLDFGAGLTAGAERVLNDKARGVAEVALGVDRRGLSQAELRAGARYHLARRVYLVGWAGGGLYAGNPWGGVGLGGSFYAVDPSEADRDDDGVRDWKDACMFTPEDKDKFEDLDGCPDPDNDADGILDADDPTPNGDEKKSLKFTDPTPRLRMKIHERRLPGDPE